MRRQFIILFAAALTLLAEVTPTSAIRYTVTDLGTLPGYQVSHPYSINDKGQIAGYVANYEGPIYHRAVLFDPNGMGNDIDLGTLGGENSGAFSINNNGQIVGAAETDLDPLDWYATIFEPNGAGDNTALPPRGAARQNNDHGQIVGYTMIDENIRRAALFAPDNEPNMISLGTLAGYPESEAVSINNQGIIVGTAFNPGFWYPYADARAVLFDPTGQGNNIDLGTLPEYQCALAISINDNGQIVGRANNPDLSPSFNWNPRAVLFDITGQGNNIDLGALPGYDSAQALCLNDKGWAVGEAIVSATENTCAILFDRNHRGNNINLNNCIDPALGCSLKLAISINNNGWIVCWGHKSGSDARAFLLKPVSAGPADFEPDTDVDLQDFAVFAAAWQTRLGDQNYNPICDIAEPKDNLIDERDLIIFADNYLITSP